MSTTNLTAAAGRCDACGSAGRPLMKLSLGKDFFGRAYDRLSPAADLSPKWYCEPCSMQKNLQRDFRDIRGELEKLVAGQTSELAGSEQLQRAQLRLREIALLLQGQASASRLLELGEVTTLLQQVQARTGPSTVAG